MPVQVWTAPADLVQPYVSGTALATSTTLTDISPVNEPSQPAYWWQKPGVGSLRVRAWGEFSTTATPTLLIGVYYGGVAGTLLCSTAAQTSISGASHALWELDAFLVCRSVGATGTVWAQGGVTGITVATARNQMSQGGATTPATATVNTTTANIITIGAQWGTSSASNTITCHLFCVEQVG